MTQPTISADTRNTTVNRPPLVVIVGATGTGKTDLSLDLAESLIAGGQTAEIVNADAMQLYRGMDIGTAKLADSERRGIPHHLLDVLAVTEESSVSRYQSVSRGVIEKVRSNGSIPILVGGSGLYVSSVIFDFQFPATDASLRASLEQELSTIGPGLLYERLLAIDPEAAASIGSRNGRRIVRALEVIELTGKPFGSGLPDESAFWANETVLLGVEAPRIQLVDRLNARVKSMWQAGLVDEVRGLILQGIETGVTASRAIGYAQAMKQLSGELTQEEAIEQTAALTRKYARRQVSWFRRYQKIAWLPSGDPQLTEQATTAVDAVRRR